MDDEPVDAGAVAVAAPDASPAPPVKDDQYPLAVQYCAVCGIPPEYCEFGSKDEFERCKVWIEAHCPELYPDLFDVADLEKRMKDTGINTKNVIPKKKQKQTGKKAKAEEVVISVAKKKGKNVVTVIHGLDLFGIKMDELAKLCKKKYACGSSVVRTADQRDTVEIQGDRRGDVPAVIREKYQIDKSKIFVTDEKKRKKPAFRSDSDDEDNADEQS